MFKKDGRLRWYQGPAKLVEIISFTVLIYEYPNNVFSFERSKNLHQIDGKINISDWCVGVMEGFELVIRDTKKKLLNLTPNGLRLFELIKSDNDLYLFTKELINNKKISNSSEDVFKNKLKTSHSVYSFLREIIFNSEQFFNALTYLSEFGEMTKNEFKTGFFERMMLLYTGEVPVGKSSGASTSDNRLPFIYQLGEYFNFIDSSQTKLNLAKSIKHKIVEDKKSNDFSSVEIDVVDLIESARVNQATPILSMSDLKNFNNRQPEKTNSINNSSVKYKTNPRVAKTAVKLADYQCEYAKLYNEKHLTFTSKFGYQYVEAHHLIPMSAQTDFININLDRTENIVSLCPICHSSIHYGSSGERFKVLDALYKLKFPNLRRISNEFEISINDLFEKYYK